MPRTSQQQQRIRATRRVHRHGGVGNLITRMGNFHPEGQVVEEYVTPVKIPIGTTFFHGTTEEFDPMELGPEHGFG